VNSYIFYPLPLLTGVVIQLSGVCYFLHSQLEQMVSSAPFFGADVPMSFSGVVDEYDPLRPNDYESFSKKRRDEKRREREDDRDRY